MHSAEHALQAFPAIGNATLGTAAHDTRHCPSKPAARQDPIHSRSLGPRHDSTQSGLHTNAGGDDKMGAQNGSTADREEGVGEEELTTVDKVPSNFSASASKKLMVNGRAGAICTVEMATGSLQPTDSSDARVEKSRLQSSLTRRTVEELLKTVPQAPSKCWVTTLPTGKRQYTEGEEPLGDK